MRAVPYFASCLVKKIASPVLIPKVFIVRLWLTKDTAWLVNDMQGQRWGPAGKIKYCFEPFYCHWQRIFINRQAYGISWCGSMCLQRCSHLRGSCASFSESPHKPETFFRIYYFPVFLQSLPISWKFRKTFKKMSIFYLLERQNPCVSVWVWERERSRSSMYYTGSLPKFP